MKNEKATNSNEVPTITHKIQEPQTITHEDEKIALILSLNGIFTIWYLFQ